MGNVVERAKKRGGRVAGGRYMRTASKMMRVGERGLIWGAWDWRREGIVVERVEGGERRSRGTRVWSWGCFIWEER